MKEVISKEKVDCDICGEPSLDDYFTIKTYIKGDIHCCLECIEEIVLQGQNHFMHIFLELL